MSSYFNIFLKEEMQSYLFILIRFGMTLSDIQDNDQIQNKVSTQFCPTDTECGSASKSPYRSIDGRCNNLIHPSWGAAITPQPRYLPAEYDDGIV